jgi:hypothetical protein
MYPIRVHEASESSDCITPHSKRQRHEAESIIFSGTGRLDDFSGKKHKAKGNNNKAYEVSDSNKGNANIIKTIGDMNYKMKTVLRTQNQKIKNLEKRVSRQHNKFKVLQKTAFSGADKKLNDLNNKFNIRDSNFTNKVNAMSESNLKSFHKIDQKIERLKNDQKPMSRDELLIAGDAGLKNHVDEFVLELNQKFELEISNIYSNFNALKLEVADKLSNITADEAVWRTVDKKLNDLKKTKAEINGNEVHMKMDKLESKVKIMTDSLPMLIKAQARQIVINSCPGCSKGGPSVVDQAALDAQAAHAAYLTRNLNEVSEKVKLLKTETIDRIGSLSSSQDRMIEKLRTTINQNLELTLSGLAQAREDPPYVGKLGHVIERFLLGKRNLYLGAVELKHPGAAVE